jgi:hypothetical protein
MIKEIETLASETNSRQGFWSAFIQKYTCRSIAEIGVYKGTFAEEMLKRNNFIQQYYLIDPWRNLSGWNKPANKGNSEFDKIYKEALQRTDFAKSKRKVLRGKTTEVIKNLDENTLDFVYVDGDHTLKGISIDMINVWPKVKDDGFIGGDDFCPTIWQHSKEFEPTMVFPFALYFAEAMDVKIFGLPFEQFLIAKKLKGYEFIDLTGNYNKTEIGHHLTGKSKKDKNRKPGFLQRFLG